MSQIISFSSGAVGSQFDTDSGSAVPSSGILTIAGGTNIGTVGVGSTVTLNLDSSISLTTVNATTFDTNVAAAGLTLAGTTLSADGTDADININITSKGTGQVIIDDLQLTTKLAITEGGTGASTFTDNGVLLGSGTSALSVTAEGATNQVLLGNTGAEPTWGAVDLTTDITGTLPIANGGTSASSMVTTYGVNYFDGTSIVTTAVGTAAQVLTSNGVGVAPTWQENGSGTVVSVTAGTNLNDSGTATDPVINLDIALTAMTSVTVSNGGSLRTGTSAADTLLLQAYDVDGASYATFATLTANNNPTMDLATDVTLGTKYIYRADGTDISVSDGGTGASTLTDNGLLYGNGTSAIGALAEATNGELPIGNTGNQPTLATLTGEHGIEVTNAAGSISIGNLLTLNAQTGTSYTTQLSDQNKLITMTNASASTLTIPLNSSVAYDVGCVIAITQLGAGQVTLTPTVGVTFRSADDAYLLYGQYSGCCLIKLDTDTWGIYGDVVA